MSGIPPLVPGLPGPGGSLGQNLVHAVLGGLSSWVAAGAVWLLRRVGALAGSAARVDLGAGWFVLREQAMRAVTAVLLAPLLLVATLGAVLRQDLRRLLRIWGVGLPVGVLGGLAGAALTATASSAVDELCTLIGGPSAGHALDRLAIELDLPGAPSFVQLLVALLVVAGAVLLWLELVLRSTAIYLAVFFFPLGAATMIWPATSALARRFVDLLGALLIAKFVVVATLSLGVAALGAARPSLDSVLIGTGVLLLAAFAPFALLRLLPLLEIGAVGHLEGLARRPAQAALGTARAVGGALGGGAGALGGETVGPLALRELQGDWSPEHGWRGDEPTGGAPPPPASPGIGLFPPEADPAGRAEPPADPPGSLEPPSPGIRRYPPGGGFLDRPTASPEPAGTDSGDRPWWLLDAPSEEEPE
jgi:hypothetical protein